MSATALARPSFRFAAGLSTALVIAGCATSPPPMPAADIAPFSAGRPGLELPHGWQPWQLARHKAPTRYDLVVDPTTGKVVLHAVAERAASGLKQPLDVDPVTRPRISWRWQVKALIDGADNTDRDAEDSPVRLMLFFDGDKGALPAREQMRLELARLASGNEPPYATLMYIWENRQPVGTVIPSAHTGRVKMVVAGTGPDRLRQWKQFERDYVQDFQRAFGEAPGRLIGIGIMTDTDNTSTSIEALYGDIKLTAPTAANPSAPPIPQPARTTPAASLLPVAR